MLPMNERERIQRIRRARAGLGALLLAVTAIVITLGYIKPDPFADKRTVRAAFEDSAGVAAVGAEVRVAGTPVGEITGRERVGDHAVLTMELDESVEVHADATAELRPHLPFEGTAFVDLELGSPAAGPLEGEIELGRTATYVPIDEAFRFLRPGSRAGLRTAMRQLGEAFGVAEAVAGAERAVEGGDELVSALGPAAKAAGGRRGTELRSAVSGLAKTLDELGGRREQFGPLLADTEATLRAFNSGGGAQLDATLAELPGTLGAVERGGRELERVLAELDPLTDELRPGVDQLAPTLSSARPLVERAGPALTSARPLIADLREGLAAGSRAADSARETIESSQPMLEQLNRSLLPALHEKTDELGIPAYLSFLNLFGGGGGASAPFQTPEQHGTKETGHFMRFGLRFITGIGLPLPPCKLLENVSPELAEAVAQAGGCTP